MKACIRDAILIYLSTIVPASISSSLLVLIAHATLQTRATLIRIFLDLF